MMRSWARGQFSSGDAGQGSQGVEDIGCLQDAVCDSVLAVGRSTVDIALPWEVSGMSLIFREEDPVDVMLNSLPAHVPVPSVPKQPEEIVKEPPLKRYDNDEDKVEGVWRRALEKWLVVVTECPRTSLIGDRVSGMAATEATATLRELFGRKSAATVLKRGSALVAFIAWCRKTFREEEPATFGT
ncbi:unnamed protein product [Symbiodinium sp. KB8]|nr:unnamed protein product [Symbiodinium sp. KB8]